MDTPSLHIPKGFVAGGAAAGIKASGALDLALLLCERPAVCAVLTTTNRFPAAPVLVCRKRAAGKTAIRGIIANSGNANAITGKGGLADAGAMARAAEEATGSPKGSFLVASTGIIGTRLPMEKIVSAVPALAHGLSDSNWEDFARGIMTTDTHPKMASRAVRLGRGRQAAILGVAKGVGMIQPNMATMLAFVATDFPLTQAQAKAMLRRTGGDTFNALTVDGQTSTNDTLILLGSERAGGKNSPSPRERAAFEKALNEVCRDLTRQIAADGEGATKLVTVEVSSATSTAEARKIGLEVANSPLVKTALFGELPNWGRIAQAMGKAGVAFDPDKVSIAMQGMKLLTKGQRTGASREELRAKLAAKEICIEIALGRGKARATVWTCDLTYGYVKINTEYN